MTYPSFKQRLGWVPNPQVDPLAQVPQLRGVPQPLSTEPHLPVQVKPVEFVMVGVFAILVCLAATVWPALHAARLRPAEAFREQQ